MQVRPGKIAFHGATFTSVTRSIRTCGVDSSARGPSSPPLTSLSPPPRLLLADRVRDAVRELEGRQDRFRGGLVKGVRFSDPRCLPSPGASRLPPVPKHEQTAEPSSKCGVHVMRIAAPRTNRPPFTSCGPRRLRSLGPSAFALGVNPLVARPPSTRLLLRPSFRPVRCRGRASLSPKTTYRLLQYDDARAPTAGRRILDRGERRRCYSPTFALCQALRADASNEPRDPHASEDARAPWTGRPE